MPRLTRLALSLLMPLMLITPAGGAVSLGQGELRAIESQALARIAASPLHAGIVIESAEREDQLEGVLVARLKHPPSAIAAVLGSDATICEMLILNVHIHACQASHEGLRITFGNPAGDPGSAREIDYVVSRGASGEQPVRLQLRAEKGPLGTGDYRIDMNALALDGGQSLVRIDYRYRIGMMGRMAMSAYLGTAGRSKIGFTREAPTEGGAPVPIGGLRGSLERNLMRYHLAMVAYLDGASGPEAGRGDARLRRWFALTEHYPAQLHEQSLDEYLRAKQRERAATR